MFQSRTYQLHRMERKETLTHAILSSLRPSSCTRLSNQPLLSLLAPTASQIIPHVRVSPPKSPPLLLKHYPHLPSNVSTLSLLAVCLGTTSSSTFLHLEPPSGTLNAPRSDLIPRLISSFLLERCVLCTL